MMEILVALLIALNGIQFVQKENTKNEVQRYETALQKAEEATKEAVEANESNDAVVDRLKSNLEKCTQQRLDDIDRANSFKEANRIYQDALNNFERNTSSLDWGTCRVPDGVDIQTILGDGNKD